MKFGGTDSFRRVTTPTFESFDREILANDYARLLHGCPEVDENRCGARFALLCRSTKPYELRVDTRVDPDQAKGFFRNMFAHEGERFTASVFLCVGDPPADTDTLLSALRTQFFWIDPRLQVSQKLCDACSCAASRLGYDRVVSKLRFTPAALFDLQQYSQVR